MSEIRVDNITNEAGTGSPDFPNGAPAQSGQVAFFAMNTPPTGWLKANGAAISRSTYSDLFDAIGTTFGAGDGSTTFNLPDMRGEFPRGWDDGRGVDDGRSFGAVQLDQMQRIIGSLLLSRDRVNSSSPQSGALSADRRDGTSNGVPEGDFLQGEIFFDSADSPDSRASSTTSGETRPRNVALLACIKF